MNIALALFILVIITFVLGIALYVWIFNTDSDWHGLSFIIWGVACVITAIWFDGKVTDPMKQKQENHKWYIESLGNDKYMDGSFFLGSGSVNETDYYFFYINTSVGSKRLKVPVYCTYITETDDRRPEYTKVINHYNDEDRFWKVLGDDYLYNKLYVPKGTIIKEFKVR